MNELVYIVLTVALWNIVTFSLYGIDKGRAKKNRWFNRRVILMVSLYSEINPMSIEITKLACQGFSDRQIGEKLGYSRQTIYRYRRSLNIVAGRNRKIQKPRVSTKKPKFLPLDKLVLN